MNLGGFFTHFYFVVHVFRLLAQSDNRNQTMRSNVMSIASHKPIGENYGAHAEEVSTGVADWNAANERFRNR